MVELQEVLRKYWGYDGFLPLQKEAMEAVLAGRDSVVVLPTGGGKSLCYQVPALCLPGMAIVVSPLIALMKDQVDGLRECGVPAAAANSSMSGAERWKVAQAIREGQVKVLYVSPERLVQERTIEFLRETRISFVAIDEAHCISEWGHDFRPEYRELGKLRSVLPGVGIHAYTATATQRVRSDIVRQLGLTAPQLLVGSFDRKNLTYKVLRRNALEDQIEAIIKQHADESGIIYCTKRADTESISESLKELGYSALPYHAGMSDLDRRRNQEAFIEDRASIIVATIAFGMGIDKPNVRYVIHAGMPKSLENYQQESGRAGRDGLEAECILIYSPAELYRWKKMIDDAEPQIRKAQQASLDAIYEYCTMPICRHQSLLRYFGQALDGVNCFACDVCLGDVELVPDALIVAQKILSSVVRQEQRYGIDYTAAVLVGSQDERIVRNRHDQLSTYGILADESTRTIKGWIDQLQGQGFLEKFGEFGVLQITAAGRQLLRGAATPRLVRPVQKAAPKRKSVADVSWEGVDRILFEKLRAVRTQLAKARNLPSYQIFGDVTLREMARRFPKTATELRKIRGVGDKKCADVGDPFLDCIREYCQSGPQNPTPTVGSTAETSRMSSGAILAAPYFRSGRSIEEVAAALGRAPSTVFNYLQEFLQHDVVVDWTPWVSDAVARQVLAVARRQPGERVKQIFEQLEGAATYEQIRIVLSCHRNRGEPDASRTVDASR
ncbi:MAG: DNA helicase RecQ [Planctomycetes bacterium]|nr:DNA helicase RecQ [Planctomycetota bacterium]